MRRQPVTLAWRTKMMKSALSVLSTKITPSRLAQSTQMTSERGSWKRGAKTLPKSGTASIINSRSRRPRKRPKRR